MGWKARTALLVVFGAVLLAPLARVLLYLWDPESASATDRVLEQADIATLLANSLFLALMATMFALLIALPVGLVLGLTRFRGHGILMALAWLPLLIPPHIHTISWARIWGNRGWLTKWLKTEHGIDFNVRLPIGNPDLDPILGHLYPGAAWILACAYFPLIVLSMLAGLRSLDPEGVTAARLHGGTREALKKVILPLIAPRIFAGAAFVFILSLSTYPVVSLLDTPTLIQRVFFTLSQPHGSDAAAAVLGLPLVIISTIVVLGLARAEAGLNTVQGGARHGVRLPASWWSRAVSCVLIFFALLLPLGALIYQAGPLNLTNEGPIDNYQSVWNRVDSAFIDSLRITAIGTLVLLLIAWPLGRWMTGRMSSGYKHQGGTLVEASALGSLAFPPEIIGVALLVWWSEAAGGEISPWFLGSCALVPALAAVFRPKVTRQSLYVGGAVFFSLVAFMLFIHGTGLAARIQGRGVTLVILALVARFLPLILRVLRQGFASLNPAEDEAAQLAGRSAWSRAWSIQGPRMRGTLAAAGVFGWVLCFTELPATLLTLRPGTQTVQVRIFNMVHYQSIEEVCALCVLVIVVAAVPVLLFSILMGSQTDSNREGFSS